MSTNTNTQAQGSLLWIDPTELVIDDNVRTEAEATLTDEFVNSVADRVLVPITAVQTPDGQIKVRDGQRRTLAARKAGSTTVPVFVTEAGDNDATAAVDRIIEQLISNDHRTAHTDTQRAAAFQQLALAGLSATKIAKRVRTSKTNVDNALTVAQSEVAMQAVAESSALTLEQGAVLAAYDNDPEALELLTTAAEQGTFDHVAAQLEATAAERAALRAATEEYLAQGISATTQRPRHDIAPGIWTLVDSEGNQPSPESIDHSYLLAYLYADAEEHWHDAEGNPIAEEHIDWDLEHDNDPDSRPAEGTHDPRTLTATTTYTVAVSWFITNPEACGLTNRYTYRSNQATDTAELSEQDQAAAEAERKEEERQARRRTIALNKLATTAKEVRMTKLAEYLNRKTLPKGKATTVAAFLTASMWQHHELFAESSQRGHAAKIATEILGTDPIEALANASAERTQIINLGIALAAREAVMWKDAWKTLGQDWDRNRATARADYLNLLTEVFGYPLSDIEHVLTGEKTPTDIDLD